MFVKNIILCLFLICVSGSIFHENTKVMFKPDKEADYFGYSVVLTTYGVVVGAPKSKNRALLPVASGLVFNCKLNLHSKNSSCFPIPQIRNRFRTNSLLDRFYGNDMWFGATMASVPKGNIFICAPRFTTPYQYDHLLAPGACYYRSKDKDLTLFPLSDKMNRQAFVTDGSRPEYGSYGTQVNFYAYGQAGMSIKVTENDGIILGAPGLTQWTGGIINYHYDKNNINNVRKDVVTNTYYTKELGPNDYFGYSVESGVFEPHGRNVIVGGAPRSMKGYGQVLLMTQHHDNQEQLPLDVLARVSGPQLGAYFGASLCCVDIDKDGVSDLLVGAPNHVKRDGGLPYDQGAVFVYMTRKTKDPFELTLSGELTGSGASGARFGTAISSLGDVDGDGFNDVAIAAPWENDGSGVVYIYKGSQNGLKNQYVQKIAPEGASSFGISISTGLDVDNNNCNDVAIGAAKSSSVYLYRCVPTIKVHASIQVPDVTNLPHNATGFTALFCITADSQPLWPHVKAGFKTKIVIDPEENRAKISGNTQFTVNIAPGNDACNEQNIDLKPFVDLSKPISIKYLLEPDDISKKGSEVFNHAEARVSEDSILQSSYLIQLTRDCGDDKICTPWLVMTLDAWDNPYVPGITEKMGATLTIINKEEPAYGAKVNITLPAIPKRLPSSCSLDNLVMTCNVPAPLSRNEEVSWEIELEYKESADTLLRIVAELHDPLYHRNISNEYVKELNISVTPIAVFDIKGKSLPNKTMSIPRENLYEADNVSFVHNFEITNFGPSDCTSLRVKIALPEAVNISNSIKGCDLNSSILLCDWYLRAKDTKSVILYLHLDLAELGDTLLENPVLNVTTTINILDDIIDGNKTAEILTTFVLESAAAIWPLILGGLVAGLILFSAIVYLLYRYGFFSRTKREELKQLIEKSETETTPGSSGLSVGYDSSTHELIFDDSDE